MGPAVARKVFMRTIKSGWTFQPYLGPNGMYNSGRKPLQKPKGQLFYMLLDKIIAQSP